MDLQQANNGINHLVENGLVLPFGLIPGSFPGGIDESIFANESAWNSYQWNPPQLMTHEEPVADANASPKPTWTELVNASNYANLAVGKIYMVRNLRLLCRTRIHEAYGQDNHHDEIELRLGGRHTEAQDAERDRLRARYTIIKNWIESTDRTLTELEALDLTDDTNWTGETWPPNRGTL